MSSRASSVPSSPFETSNGLFHPDYSLSLLRLPLGTSSLGIFFLISFLSIRRSRPRRPPPLYRPWTAAAGILHNMTSVVQGKWGLQPPASPLVFTLVLRFGREASDRGRVLRRAPCGGAGGGRGGERGRGKSRVCAACGFVLGMSEDLERERGAEAVRPRIGGFNHL